jgi:thiosulfate/3-mercaptopyruvate sulfurtransferase
MLIDSSWLVDNLDEPIIIDTRGKIAYSYAHIPNAIPLNVEDLMIFKGSAGYIADGSILSELGIDKNRKIVLYGEYLDPSIARVYWSLLYYGYDVHMLNIGFMKWAKSNLPITRSMKSLDKVELVLDYNDSIITDAKYILDKKPLLIDCRSTQEYMQGKIPSAINIPWENNVGKDKIFADRDDIIDNLRDLIDGKEIVCYCTHGIRASHTFAALRLIGVNTRVYDGSIADWISKRLPIE